MSYYYNFYIYTWNIVTSSHFQLLTALGALVGTAGGLLAESFFASASLFILPFTAGILLQRDSLYYDLLRHCLFLSRLFGLSLSNDQVAKQPGCLYLNLYTCKALTLLTLPSVRWIYIHSDSNCPTWVAARRFLAVARSKGDLSSDSWNRNHGFNRRVRVVPPLLFNLILGIQIIKMVLAVLVYLLCFN